MSLDVDRVRHAALRIAHHRPIEAGDLAGPETGFDREQDHDAVALGERGRTRDVADQALQHGRGDHLRLFAGHGNKAPLNGVAHDDWARAQMTQGGPWTRDDALFG